MATYLCTACGKEVVGHELWFNQAGQPYHHACYAQRFGSNSVVVRDVQIPFGTMVVLLFKFSVAAIPVGIVLGIVWWVIAAACGVYP